jgi:hypothetical protein
MCRAEPAQVSAPVLPAQDGYHRFKGLFAAASDAHFAPQYRPGVLAGHNDRDGQQDQSALAADLLRLELIAQATK